MSNDETAFDWSPLGAEWWEEARRTCGATELQARFGCLRHRGMTAARAAREAGYTGDNDSIRQAGSRAAKTTAVMAMQAMAASETGGGDDGTVTRAEAKRILSRLARHSDPNVRIKALDSLSKIEERETGDSAERSLDPVETLREIAQISPDLAEILAADEGIDFEVSAELKATIADRRAALARKWIQSNPDNAKAMLAELETTAHAGA